jgi:hypothetical protein
LDKDDDAIETDLPDLSKMSLQEFAETDNPAVQRAQEKVAEETTKPLEINSEDH